MVPSPSDPQPDVSTQKATVVNISKNQSKSNFKGILNQRSPPNLSLDAKNWIVEMNTNYGKGINITNDIFDFIEYFGTHIVRYANMRNNFLDILSLYLPAISSLELDSLTSSR